jgi:hypothetical protein
MDDKQKFESKEEKEARMKNEAGEAGSRYEDKAGKAEDSFVKKAREAFDKNKLLKATLLTAAEAIPTGIGTLTAGDTILLAEAVDDYRNDKKGKAALRTVAALIPGPVSELDVLIDMLPDKEKDNKNQNGPDVNNNKI